MLQFHKDIAGLISARFVFDIINTPALSSPRIVIMTTLTLQTSLLPGLLDRTRLRIWRVISDEGCESGFVAYAMVQIINNKGSVQGL